MVSGVSGPGPEPGLGPGVRAGVSGSWFGPGVCGPGLRAGLGPGPGLGVPLCVDASALPKGSPPCHSVAAQRGRRKAGHAMPTGP